MAQPMEYCDLCVSQTNSWEYYRHSEGGLYRLCFECIEMVRDGEPVTDDKHYCDYCDIELASEGLSIKDWHCPNCGKAGLST